MAHNAYGDSTSESEGTVISDSEVERERERRIASASTNPKPTRVLHDHGRDVIVISSDDDSDRENEDPAKRRRSGTICPLDDDSADEVPVVTASQQDELAIDEMLVVEAPKQLKRQASVAISHNLVNAADWDDDFDDAIIEVDASRKTPLRKPPVVQQEQRPARSSSPSESLPPTPRSMSTVSSPSKAKTPRKKKVDPELERRLQMANALFQELNNGVFNQQLVGVDIKWNPRFLTTAGRAKWKKSSEGVHTSSIELSPKVIDSDDRLRNTVAHEMCHLASWIIDGVPTEQHGNIWNGWTSRVMELRPDIKISAKHSYDITFKFNWECSSCSTKYGRHSKSIDPATQMCACGGALVALFQEKSRGGGHRRAANASRLAADKPQGSPTPRWPGIGLGTPVKDTPTKSRGETRKVIDVDEDAQLDDGIAQLVRSLAESTL